MDNNLNYPHIGITMSLFGLDAIGKIYSRISKIQPGVLTRVGQKDLDIENKLRPACAFGKSFKEYP